MHFTTVTVSTAFLATLSLASAAPGIVNGSTTTIANKGTIVGDGWYRPTKAPEVIKKAVAPRGNYNGQPLTIHIRNTAGDSMHMNLNHNADSPPAICCPHNGPLPSSTQVVYPSGWAGRISIGPNPEEGIITKGSTIEAAVQNSQLHFDVSYASGYTYPIVCNCNNGPISTGCNYPLLAHAQEDGGCPSPGPQICYNPDVLSDQPRGSPANHFFEPCQGAAFTYPHDYDAQDDYCNANDIYCCVGILCPPNPRQHKGKRDLEFAMDNGTLPYDTA